jgi:hypothetical protein
MKAVLFIAALLLSSHSAHAAAGYICAAYDGIQYYSSTGRFADWGKRHVTQKCPELSQNPAACHFIGCQKKEISAEWARRSDQERVKLNRKIKQIYADAARKERRQKAVRRQPETDTSFIDEAIRRRDEFDRVDRERRIDDFLNRQRRGW